MSTDERLAVAAERIAQALEALVGISQGAQAQQVEAPKPDARARVLADMEARKR